MYMIKQGDLFESSRVKKDSFHKFCSAIGCRDSGAWTDGFGVALLKWSSHTMHRPIRTLSLFSGAGGLDIAFHEAGFQIGDMVEIDSRFVATLSANSSNNRYLGGAKPICCDICDYHPREHSAIDFIIGGPPCQTFSAAGRRAAGVRGTRDKRGTLFEEYVRLLKSLRPRGFLFENVYGITGAEQGQAWERIRLAFQEAGYWVHHRILDAADFGVPQHRERLFIVGTQDASYRFPQPTHGPDSESGRPHYTAGEAVADAFVSPEEQAAVVGGRFGPLLKQIPPGLNYSFFTEKMGHPRPIFAWRSKFSDFLYKAEPDAPIRTLKAQGGQYTGPFHWDSRPFSLGELKRLQTIPDKYAIVGGRQVAIHQIGNSVPPQLGRILAITILNQLFGVELPAHLPTLHPRDQLSFRQRKRELTAVYRTKALASLKDNGAKEHERPIPARSRSYRAQLHPDFGWKVMPRQQTGLRVSCRFTKSQWKIRVAEDMASADDAFCIAISSASIASWALGDTGVVLSGDLLDKTVYTAVWKAFETELIRLHIKADLVQLCGYYQYQPAFKCSLGFSKRPSLWKWRALKHVVAGEGIARILSEHEMSELYNISPDKVFAFGVWLRSLGYEIRNHNTNPQVPSGSYLIPYAFPTLIPLSVQLRKSFAGVSSDE